MVFGLFGSTAHAEGAGFNETDMDFLAHLFVRSEEATGIPRYLFAAIAAQESQFWPWSVNLAGQSYYEQSREAALARIEGQENFDLGIMQINSWWLPRFGVSAEDVLDPAFNVFLGSTILLDCIKRYGIWDGIACYHAGSPKKEHGMAYAIKVIEKWRNLTNLHPAITVEPEESR